MYLDNNNHSVFKLYYHLIIVTKYRRKVLDDEILNFMIEKFKDISRKYNIHLDTMNHDGDHVHILFRAHPNSDLSKFINAYKSSTSRTIKNKFPQVREKLWKSMFWTKSYCLITSGGVSTEVIGKYIETQATK